ncbi:hypothetical protein ACFX1Z_046229 [Malus domestica]
MGFQKLNRRAQKSKKPFKNRRGASFLKSWACSQTTNSIYRRVSAFSASSAPITRNSALRKSRAVCRSADSNHLSLSASSALVTCTLCPQRSSELEAQIPDIKEASALSRRVSIYQIAHLRCVNHAQSVENFWRSGMHVKTTVKLSQAGRRE